MQAPEDLAYYKLRRLMYAIDNRRLSPEDELAVKQIASGRIDDVVVGDLPARRAAMNVLQDMTMEELVRLGFEKTAERYNQYRDGKNVYDLLLLVETHRQTPIFSDPRIIRQNIEADPTLEKKSVVLL